MPRKIEKARKPRHKITEPTARTIAALNALISRPYSMSIKAVCDELMHHGVTVSIGHLSRIRSQQDRREASPVLADAMEALLCSKSSST